MAPVEIQRLPVDAGLMWKGCVLDFRCFLAICLDASKPEPVKFHSIPSGFHSPFWRWSYNPLAFLIFSYVFQMLTVTISLTFG